MDSQDQNEIHHSGLIGSDLSLGNGQHAGEVLAEVSETHFTAAPICLVLTEDVQKIFAKGDPLIVGTSMADIQSFFQKVISEAQLGMESSSRTGTEATPSHQGIRTNTSRTVDLSQYNLKSERYPVPRFPTRIKSQKKEKVADDDEEMERCEIPLDAIRLYLKEKKYFPGWSSNSKRNLRKRCDDFALEDGMLMYRTRKGTYVQCVEDTAERMRLLWQQHSIDHRRRDRLFQSLKEKYYWKGMLYDINKVLASCEYCTRMREEKNEQDQEKSSISEPSKKPKTARKRPKLISEDRINAATNARIASSRSSSDAGLPLSDDMS